MTKFTKYKLYWEDVGEKLIFAELDDLAWKLAERTFHYKKLFSVYTFRHNRLAAFYSENDVVRESKVGYLFYTKPTNVDRIIDLKKNTSKRIQAELKEFKKIRPGSTNKTDLKKLIIAALGLYSQALSVHYLTQPQFFERFEVRGKRALSFKAKLNALANARLRYTRPAWTNAMSLAKKLLYAFDRHHDLEQGSSENLSFEEFTSGKIPRKIIRNRAKQFVLISNHHHFKIYDGSKANKYIQHLERYNSTKVVTGVRGREGHVTGRAFVVKNENLDLNKLPKGMRKGMILILQNAWPEFNVYYNKAAAIVTNEGGVTSHGVVVARELRIPCVVGTKIATKVFQTGDLVEVNANKGTIEAIQ